LESTCRLPVGLDDECDGTAALRQGLSSVLHSSAGPASGWAITAGLSLRGLERTTRRRAA
jgi:hypothetical protein